jgi:hypothetical protein
MTDNELIEAHFASLYDEYVAFRGFRPLDGEQRDISVRRWARDQAKYLGEAGRFALLRLLKNGGAS